MTKKCFVDSQTSNFYCWVVIALFAEGNLAINTIAYFFLCLIKSDDIVLQTEIGCNNTTLLVNDKINSSQKFRLVILRLVNQKVVQVTFCTLERIKISCGKITNKY